MFLTISLAIVDTRSYFDAPQPGEVIAGQTARCLLCCLGCDVERSGTDISHTLIFYFPNVQWIVQFVMCTEWKPRTERFNTSTRIITPLIYCIYLLNFLGGLPVYLTIKIFVLHCKIIFIVLCRKKKNRKNLCSTFDFGTQPCSWQICKIRLFNYITVFANCHSLHNPSHKYMHNIHWNFIVRVKQHS